MTRDHTPTPWQAVPNVFGVYGLFHIGADDDGKSTSIRIGTIDSMPNTKANAVFIANACNNYDQLIDLARIIDGLLGTPKIAYLRAIKAKAAAILAKVQS